MIATNEEYEARIKAEKWFHAIDFGNGLKSSGRFAIDITPNWTLLGVLHLLEQMQIEGLRCLDIGAFDGLVSFILKSAGAKDVLATDIFDKKTLRLGRELLELDIDYLPNQALETLPQALPDQKFDLIVMAGVLYHLYSPLDGLANCRRLISNGGMLIIETEVVSGDEPHLFLNSSSDEYPEAFTYWRPTVSGLKDMLKFCCFNVIAEVKTDHRYTVLAQAVRPSDVKEKTRSLEAIHSQVRPVVPSYLDFKAIEQETLLAPVKVKAEIPIYTEIDPKDFSCSFSLQPESNV